MSFDTCLCIHRERTFDVLRECVLDSQTKRQSDKETRPHSSPHATIIGVDEPSSPIGTVSCQEGQGLISH